MKRRILRAGPGAASLLLAIVVVSMAILSWLALISARNDYKLTARGIEFAVADAAASAEAEFAFAHLDALAEDCGRGAADDASYLAAIRAALGADMTLEDDVISWENRCDTGRMLKCAARVLPLGSDARLEWRMHMFVPEEEKVQPIMDMEPVEQWISSKY